MKLEEKALKRLKFIRDNYHHFLGLDYKDKEYLRLVIEAAEQWQEYIEIASDTALAPKQIAIKCLSPPCKYWDKKKAECIHRLGRDFHLRETGKINLKENHCILYKEDTEEGGKE